MPIMTILKKRVVKEDMKKTKSNLFSIGIIVLIGAIACLVFLNMRQFGNQNWKVLHDRYRINSSEFREKRAYFQSARIGETSSVIILGSNERGLYLAKFPFESDAVFIPWTHIKQAGQGKPTTLRGIPTLKLVISHPPLMTIEVPSEWIEKNYLRMFSSEDVQMNEGDL